MFERLPFDCAMLDDNVDIPEDKIDDETLPTAPCLMIMLTYLKIK